MLLPLLASTTFYNPACAAPVFSHGKAFDQPGAPWGLARISHPHWSFNNNGNTFFSNPNNAYHYFETEGKVTIYMLDTGVDVNHAELDGRARDGPNFVPHEDSQDYSGHGTHLAGIAIGKTMGVARNAELVSVKILDKEREGALEHMKKAIDWVIEDNKANGGRAIINYSAVGQISDYRTAALKRATENGIAVVNAGGNFATDSCQYGPANLGPNFDGLMVVAALNWTNTAASFSNFGRCVDIWAPGVDIHSSLPGGGYGYMDGTSNAAAFVSGIMAYLWSENPELSLKDLTNAVRAANPNGFDVNRDDTTSAIAYNYYE